MKKFEAPSFEEIDELMLEPVYAGSGSHTTEETEEPPHGDWDITATWRNHNSGSHSELAIRGVHHGAHPGEVISMTFVVHGFKLQSVKDNGGWPVTNISETGFTITRTNHFNPTDNFEFNIQVTATDDTTANHGAVGVTGYACGASVVCVSYVES